MQNLQITLPFQKKKTENERAEALNLELDDTKVLEFKTTFITQTN
jgi:hypothetical protein